MKIRELIERLAICEDHDAEIVVCLGHDDKEWEWWDIACIGNDSGNPDTYFLGLMPLEEEV